MAISKRVVPESISRILKRVKSIPKTLSLGLHRKFVVAQERCSTSSGLISAGQLKILEVQHVVRLDICKPSKDL